MNNVGEKYLPIGTVVMLKGGTKRVMITGFCSMAKDNADVMYDYSGCLYPEGILSANETAVFDHEQIDRVYNEAYTDEEELEFKKKLKEEIAKVSNG